MLRSRPDVAAELIWRPFLLNPDLAPQGVPRQEYLVRKFGGEERARIPASGIAAWLSVVAAAAAIAVELSLSGTTDLLIALPTMVGIHVLIGIGEAVITMAALGFIAVFPLTFASSAFVPVDSMPDGLQQFAEVNPFTTVTDAIRALWLGAPAGNDIWGAVLWSLGIIAVFGALSIRRYQLAVTR